MGVFTVFMKEALVIFIKLVCEFDHRRYVSQRTDAIFISRYRVVAGRSKQLLRLFRPTLKFPMICDRALVYDDWNVRNPYLVLGTS